MDIVRDTAGRGGTNSPGPEQASSIREDTVREGEASTARSTSYRSRPRAAARSPDPPPTRPSFSQFIDEVRAALRARIYLFELEAKRAASSAAYMLAFATAAALLGVTAWLVLIGALIYGAVSAGVPWIVAAIVAIALHAVGAFMLVRAIRSMVDNLTFAATRRTLAKADSAEAPDGRSS